MENFTYPPSYPDSGNSSPRSREIDFDNPAPWEDSQNPQQNLNYKVKFMCSYGGKIHPRPHDNLLSYIGGETKILSVDRNMKFATLVAKLSALCDTDGGVSFKYQLPGEDLDALISVTNDDDLEHMMHEYDRLFRASPKPARLRLFLFPANTEPPSQSPPTVVAARSFGSDDQVIKSEKERFVEALNSGPIHASPPPSAAAQPPPPPQAGNVDFLLGLEKGMVQPPLQQQQLLQPPPPVVTAGKLRDPLVAEQTLHEHEIPVPGLDERLIGSDRIQKHIQDLQRLRIEEQQGLYRRKSDDNMSGGYPVGGGGGEYYVQKVPPEVSPATVPGTVAIPTTGYWPEKQVAGGVFPATTFGSDQPVYMIPAPAGAYHPQMVRPVTGPTGQGYYTVQRLPEMYREQPQPYNVGQQMGGPPVQSAAAPPPTLPSQGPTKMSAPAAYSEGYGMVRAAATTGGVGGPEMGYTQAQLGPAAYDNGVGRQVYYNAQAGVNVMGPPPPQAQLQGVQKVVPKPTQASV